MSKKIKIVSVIASILVILVLATFNTEHVLILETGEQMHIRSIIGIELEFLSKKGVYGCDSWINPLPYQTDEVVLSSCSLFSCKYNNAIKFKC